MSLIQSIDPLQIIFPDTLQSIMLFPTLVSAGPDLLEYRSRDNEHVRIYGKNLVYLPDGTLVGGTITKIVTSTPRGDELAITQISLSASDFYTAFMSRDASAVVALLGDITFYGNGGSDWLTGGEGSDQLYGRDGDDVLQGLGGDDLLSGGRGWDELVGGDGNDTLDGGPNDAIVGDDMRGGLGDDVYYVNANDSVHERSSEGFDTVFIYSRNVIPASFDNVEKIVFLGTGNQRWTGNISSEEIIGNIGKDFLWGDDGNDTISGADGNDDINGESGDDLIHGNAGNDSLRAGLGTDTVFGDDGNDTIYAGPAGILNGGNGDDLYFMGYSQTAAIIVERRDGGIDTVQSGVSYTLGANVENLWLLGIGLATTTAIGIGNNLGNRIEDRSGTFAQDSDLRGGRGNDTLIGEAGNDTLNGGLGADFLSGGEDDDLYIVDNRQDVVSELGTTGGDLVLSSVSYTLAGGVEQLTLTGNVAVRGTGNALDNLITGNGLSNILAGMDGDDLLIGGTGSDTLSGGTGEDIASYASATSALTADLATSGLNSGAALGDVYVSIEGLIGSRFADVLGGNAGNNGLAGGGGGDTLSGGGGNDLLFGDSGNDSISGGMGNDQITGGTGRDRLSGGNGADFFIFNDPLDGADIISDFTHGTDKIALSIVPFFSLESLVQGTNFFIDSAPTQFEPTLIYLTSLHLLQFDPDGAGSSAPVDLARFSNGVTLGVSDFTFFFG